MGREHSTRAQVQHGNCHAVADGCWPCGGIGVDNGAGRVGVGLLGTEVEEPVTVCEKCSTVEAGSGVLEREVEGWVFGYIDGGDDGNYESEKGECGLHCDGR